MLREAAYNTISAINSNLCLHDLDSYITTLLTGLPIENLFSILEQVDANIASQCPFTFPDRDVLSKLKKQIDNLEHIPGFNSVCDCTISDNISLHSKYDRELSNSSHDEFLYTINI